MQAGGFPVDNVTISLPWPPTALRPNASSPGSWRKKQTAAKHYKAICLLLCRPSWLFHWDAGNFPSAHLTITFRPPDKRRRDLDNMLASFKQGIDAIAETMGVDDYHFGYTILRGEPIKDGAVDVIATPN